MSNSTDFPHGTPNSYARRKCRCEECTRAYNDYHVAYRARTLEYRRAQARATYAKNRDSQNAARQARYMANIDRERRNARLRYEENIEARRAAQVEWGRQNKELRRAAHARRKALKRQASLFEFTALDWSRLCSRFDQRCAYCGERKPLTQDHVVPIVRGGTHSIGNILPCCASCNSSKGPKLLSEWLLWKKKQLIAKVA